MNPLRRLYGWVLQWSRTPYAVWALFGLAVVEASVFPIPPDVLLLAMGVALPSRALYYAGVCTVGSLLGGVIGYGIGWGLWAVVGEFFLTYLLPPEVFHRMVATYHEAAFITILTAAFTPIPYKVITLSAGVAHIPLTTLLLASALGRAARFFAVAGLLYFLGPMVQHWIERYFNWVALGFGVLLVGGFLVLRYLG